MLHPQHAPAVRVWDAVTGRIILDINTRSAVNDRSPFNSEEITALRGVESVAFSPDGRRILTVENFGPGVCTWNASTGALERTFELSMPAAFLPGGNRIIGAANGHLAVLDADSGERLLTLRQELMPMTRMAISADGTLLEQHFHGPIRLWDATPTYEPEAWNYVEGLFCRLGFYDAVVASIRSDRGLIRAIRETALRLAGTVRDSFPEAHDRASWSIVKSPGGQLAAYREALERSLAACRIAPWNPDYCRSARQPPAALTM